MNAQQLKNAILQEAIEGRLVPQDPNDEPALALLARIRKEKEQLVKAGKLKKKDLEVKPISEDEIPFEIPDSWEWVRLKDIVMFIGGYAYDSTSFISNSNNQVLRLGNVKNDNILLNVNSVFIDDKLASDTEKFRCKENDILITMTGTRKKRDYFFSVLVNRSHHNLFINQRVGCLRSINENIAKWLIVALKAETILTDVFQYETGTANQGNLGAENILKTKIPLPPLAEQLRIVAKIEELLPKVEEYGKAQEALNKLNLELPERLKKSILQEAITGRLVPQDPNDEPASVLLAKIRKEKEQLVKAGKLKKKDIVEVPIVEDDYPYSIPESWCWVRLEDITTYISRGKSPIYSDLKKYPIVAQKCNQWSGFSLEKAKFADPTTIEKYAEERILRDGDLLWNSTGLGTLGRMAIYNSEVNPYRWAAADSHVTVIRTRPDFCVYKYLYYYFASNEVQSVIEDKSDGSTKQKELYLDTVKKYEVPLPPLAEQHRIVEKLEQLLGEIDKLKVKGCRIQFEDSGIGLHLVDLNLRIEFLGNFNHAVFIFLADVNAKIDRFKTIVANRWIEADFIPRNRVVLVFWFIRRAHWHTYVDRVKDYQAHFLFMFPCFRFGT